MKDVLDELRGTSDRLVLQKDLNGQIAKLIEASSAAVRAGLEPFEIRWLAKVLSAAHREDGTIGTLDAKTTVTERFNEARLAGNAIQMANTGKISLLAAAGIGRRSILMDPEYYANMAHMALRHAAQWRPDIDQDVDLDPEASLSLVGDMSLEELELEQARLEWERRTKPPVLKRVAFHLPPIVESLRFFKTLCVQGDKVEAFVMTGEISVNGAWSLN